MFVCRMRHLFIIFCLFLISSSEPLDNNGTSGDTIDGEQLVKLGRRLNKPMLTLIGMAIHNMHPCEKWTQWSPCSTSRPGFFGSRSRARTCANTNNANEFNATKEEVFQICEGAGNGDVEGVSGGKGAEKLCPNAYNVTSHGYCIKLYDVKMSNDDANKHCKQDGGYLVNIDTQQKHEDIEEVLQGNTNKVAVGDRRKDVSSPWTYEYGSQNGFIEWHSPGQPDNALDQLCLLLNELSKLWHDYKCSDLYTFLCEIV